MKLPPGHVAGMGVHKATAYGGFGQKMLEKMGWNEGQGLGKEKHGMREAIEVKKKEDNLGVGANTTGWKWDWKYWEDAYTTGLQNISKSDRKRKRQKLSSSSRSSSGDSSEPDCRSDSDSSESDDEHNVRIAEACGVVFNRDGTAASASTAELKLAEELAKDCRGPAGRFGGRAGKMARIRQQEEEQAAAVRARLGIPQSASTGNLGNSSASEDTSACKNSSKKRKQLSASAAAGSSSDAEQESAVAVEQRQQQQQKKTKRGRKDAVDTNSQQQQQPASEQEAAATAAADARKAPLVIVVDIKGAGPNVEAFESFKPTPTTGWWGAKVFASAGLLESIEDEDEQRRRTTFDEDMQTRVYMAAHNAQRQGRKGLGKSTAVKIAGGNWQGKKVAFDQEPVTGADNAAAEQPGNDQQQEQQARPTAASSSPSSTAAIITKVISNTTRTRQQKKQKDSNKPGKVRWAKLAVMQLQEVPGGVLKWSRLWKQLKHAAQMQQVEVAGSCKERALRKLQGCSQLQVMGKLVSLVA